MSPEAFRIGANVSTAFGALGLAIVVLLFAYYRHLRNTELTLKQIPANQRAKAFDSYLTRYRVDASNLQADKMYELIKLELEKRSSRVTLFTIVFAGVFVVCFLTATLRQGTAATHQEQKPGQPIAGDLAPVFGTARGLDRVRNVPRKENTGLLRQWLANSQKSVKIVTINGSSWIKPDLMTAFEQATARMPVTLMLLDYTDKKSMDVWNDAMNEYGESVWTKEQFNDNFLSYAKLLQPKNHLRVGLYREYPWSRFTIFDDRAVSFIVTPVVEAGDSVLTYFSEDPFVVRCFEQIFERIEEDANGRGRIFSDGKTATQFATQHESNMRGVRPGVEPSHRIAGESAACNPECGSLRWIDEVDDPRNRGAALRSAAVY